VKNKAKRKGRGTAIGDDMVLRPKRLVAFKCSGKLKKKVNTNE
jgi:integration host factor subunit alpha